MPIIDPISPISAPYGIQPPLAFTSPQPSETTDTLTVAPPSASTWTPSRPELTHPNQLGWSTHRFLATTEVTRNLGNQILDTLTVRLASVKNKIREISTENMQKLRESAEHAASSTWWGILKKIATCLLSALSIVFGAAFIASGGAAIIGGAMIASGVLSLANFALAESGAWDWVAKQLSNDDEEWRKRLMMILPGAVGLLAGGIGLVGSIYSLSTGAVQFAEKALYIAQTGLAIFDGLTTFGKGQADARLLRSQADLAEIQGQLTLERNNFDSIMREVEGSLSDFRAMKNKAKQTVQTLARTNTQLMQNA